MSHKLNLAARRAGFVGGLIPPLCLFLSACGGGGDSHVASLPPPPPTPTPTPTPPPGLPSGTVVYTYPLSNSLEVRRSWLDSPATRLGNYGLLGRLTVDTGQPGSSTSRTIAPNEFNMTVANAAVVGLSYTLNAPADILPTGLTSSSVGGAGISWDINPNIAFRYTNAYGDTPQYFGERLAGFDKPANGNETQLFSYDFTRGSTGTFTSLGSGNSLRTSLDYDIGYSYVAMGEWSWRIVDLNGASVAGTESGDLLFVNGDRTPASAIPASGTATYDARSLALRSSSGTPGIPFSLSADFGQQTMSARIDQDYRYDAADASAEPILGVHVGGSAPFANSGSFDIPLTGTANYSAVNSSVTPASESVTGAMNGAFFGPQAEQVGGTFSLERAGGTQLLQDAFVGQRRP